MEYLIYLITREDGQQYVGTTDTRNYKSRMRCHAITDRFKGYEFSTDILESSEDIAVHDKEAFYIKVYDTFHNGLNSSIDGKGNHLAPSFTTRGYKFSDESKKKMSEAKKGKTAWNKGKTGIYSEETIKRWSESRKGRIHSSKLSKEDVIEIRRFYATLPEVDGVGKVMRNGKKMTYERAFSKEYCTQWDICEQNLYKIITNKSWKNVS